MAGGWPARAELAVFYEFLGHGNWAIDGGNTAAPLEITVPEGSAVERAFLYSAIALGTPAPAGVTPTVVLEGVPYGPAEFTPLTFVGFPGFATGMQAFRADATAQIAALVGSGSPSTFTLSVDSESTPLGRTTGTVLVVIYANGTQRYRQITLADGGAAPAGDALTLGLAQGVDPAAPSFEALLSVAIGFSTATADQRTLLAVGGRPLTSSAGGLDDSLDGLTVGGFQDSPVNPADPSSPSEADDELYDLARGNGVDPAPFLPLGTTAVVLDSSNPSEDDHLFFVGLNVTLQEVENAVEVPALGPGGMTLLAFVLAGLGLGLLARRRSRKTRPSP